MTLKKRFKNRLVKKPFGQAYYNNWITAKDFRDGIGACLANPNFRKNWKYIIKQKHLQPTI